MISMVLKLQSNRWNFEYILEDISKEIAGTDTPNRRLAITLYYLASTSEYRTIAKLVWGSQK